MGTNITLDDGLGSERLTTDASSCLKQASFGKNGICKVTLWDVEILQRDMALQYIYRHSHMAASHF